MIRRISANNDYRDIVRSCPSGVIDDIYAIEYYVKGYDGVYSAAFSKTGRLLEVIIPSSALKTLHSGVLMRRAKYRNADTSFPDQYYDLEFVEDMNVWLENGSEPGPGPEPGEYVTEEELAETLEGYVTDEEFSGAVEDINNNMQLLDDRVTVLEHGGSPSSVSWGGITGTITDQTDLVNYIGNQGYVTTQDLAVVSDAAQQAQQTASQAQNAAFSAQDSVQQMSSDLSDMDIIVGDLSDSVSGLDQRVTDLENAAFQDQIDGLDQRVTDLEQGGGGGGASWGNITGDIQDQQDLMDEFDADRSRLNDLENAGFATEQWVEDQNYVQYNTDSPLYNGYNKVITTFQPGNSYCPLLILTNNEEGADVQYDGIKIDPTGIYKYSANNIEDPGSWTTYEEELATQDWVQNQGYATQTWVQNQGYLDSNSTLPADQITCNISGDVFDFDDVDEGLTSLVSKVEEQIDDITSLDNRVTALEQSGGGGGTWGSITGTISDQTDLMNLLSGYATQSWVGQQGYITSSALNGYATQQWATNQFLEENKVWAGTAAQWANLTAEEKASYKIALVTA